MNLCSVLADLWEIRNVTVLLLSMSWFVFLWYSLQFSACSCAHFCNSGAGIVLSDISYIHQCTGMHIFRTLKQVLWVLMYISVTAASFALFSGSHKVSFHLVSNPFLLIAHTFHQKLFECKVGGNMIALWTEFCGTYSLTFHEAQVCIYMYAIYLVHAS